MFSLITDNGFKGFTDLSIEFVSTSEVSINFRYGGQQVERVIIHTQPQNYSTEEKEVLIKRFISDIRDELLKSVFIDKDTIAEIVGGKVLRGSDLKSIRIL